MTQMDRPSFPAQYKNSVDEGKSQEARDGFQIWQTCCLKGDALATSEDWLSVVIA